MGNDKKEIAQFSFLMVLVPIIAANVKSLIDFDGAGAIAGAAIGSIPLLIGFLAAFITGWLACSWMVNLVKKGKLIWFALYCFVIGLLAIISGFII